jgi:hypothetical protein
VSEKRAATLERRAARKARVDRRRAERVMDAKDPPWFVQEYQRLNAITWDKFVKTPDILPSLNHRPGKKKAMYRQRREACAAVGRANGLFCNLETFQIGYPCTKVPGGTRYRTQKERAAAVSLGVRTFRRAEKDMRDGNLYPCYKRVTETKQDGTKRGRAWARTITPNLYKAAGTWAEIKRLRRECYKTNQEKREKPDEAGKARADLLMAGLLGKTGKRKSKPRSQQYDEAALVARKAEMTARFKAWAEAEKVRGENVHYGIDAPPKPT